MASELVPRGWKTVAFLAAYSVLWVVCDVAGAHVAGADGFGAWYVNPALDVVLFLVMGWRWWPLPALLFLVSYGIDSDRAGSLQLNFLSEIPYELFYAVGTWACVDLLGVRFPLRGMRDIAVFAGVLGGLATVFANGAVELIYNFYDPVIAPPDQFLNEVIRGAGADTTAIMVLVPAITQLLAWHRPLAPDGTERGVRVDGSFLAGLVVTAGVVVGEYLAGVRIGRALVEFSFLPLAWLAVTFGMRGAVLGILVADVSVTFMHVLLKVPVDSQIQYQGYLVASALMALLLGAIANDQQNLLGRLERSAYVDALTDLPNTNRLLEWIRAKAGEPVTLAVVDIADLRVLNEGVGRESVDGLLLEFSARLRSGLDGDHFIARVGSSEFAVAVSGDVEAQAMAEPIATLLSEPFRLDGADVFVDVAIGATRTGAADNAQELMRRVDLAVRRAKTEPTRSAVYEKAIDQVDPETPLVVELHHAAEAGEFVPFFQPIYRYRDRRWTLSGAEMLMRWRHPQRGLLSPDSFIDLLERLSICNRIGWSLLDQSLPLAMQWRETVPEFALSVNFFPRQVLDPRCSEKIGTALATAKAVPQALIVEITERVVSADEQAFATLAGELHARGVAVAIDDFGTGNSSLARLREVPAELLKIDRSFVNRSDVDAKAMSVASTVVRLGAELDMSVVAEGIENAQQAEAMVKIGCEYGQGYAFGHPAPARAFEKMLYRSISFAS